MYKERIRTIGISLLGGNSGTAGRYELGIDSIGITNDEYIEPIARGELVHFHGLRAVPKYSIQTHMMCFRCKGAAYWRIVPGNLLTSYSSSLIHL